MTYSITNRAVTLALGTALLGAMLLPSLTHAQILSQGSFCNNLDRLKAQTMERQTERTQANNARRGGQETGYQERKTARLGELEQNRAQADAAREAGYARVEAVANTAAGEAAVATYRARIETAVQGRRAAMDDAIGAFENRAQELWDAREADAEAIAGDLEADLEEIFATAENACKSDDPGTVRAELRKGVADLGNSYRDRVRTQSNRDAYQEAQSTMRAASEAAWETFRAEAATARTELRAAFGA